MRTFLIRLLVGLLIGSSLDCGMAVAGPSAPVDVQAHDLHAEGIFGALRMPTLEATGSNLEAAEIAKLLDPDSLATFVEQFANARIDSLRIPQLVFQAAVDGHVVIVRIQGLEVEGLRNGTAAKIAVAGINRAITASPTAAKTTESARGGGIEEGLNVGHAVGVGADLGLLVKLISGLKPAQIPSLRTLFRSLDIEAIAYSRGGSSLCVASVASTQLQARLLLRPLSEVARAMSAPEDDLEALRTLSASLIDLAHGVAFESLDIRGLRMPPLMAAGRLQLSHYADGVLGGVSAGDLEAADSRLKIRDLRFYWLDFGGLLNAAALSAKNPARAGQLARFKLYPTVRHAQGAAITYEPSAKDQILSKEQLSSLTVTNFQFDRSAASDGLPTAMNWVMNGVATMPPAANAGTVVISPPVTFSAQAAIQWDHPAQTLTLQELAVKLPNAADIDVQARFVDVGTGLYDDEWIKVTAAALRAKLADATVSVKNHGLVDWLLPPEGARRDAAIEQMRAAILGRLGDQPGIRAFADEFAAFARRPHRLTIRLQAPDPIGVTALASGAKMPLLDLQANTSP